MKHGFTSYLFIILTVAFTPLTNTYADTSLGETAFRDSLGRALNKTREFESYDYAGWNRTDIHGTGIETLNTAGSQGSWRLSLHGHFDIKGYGMKTVHSNSGTAVVTNFGNRYEYVFMTQKMQPGFIDVVYDKLGERLESMKNSDDAPQNLAWQRQDNAILVGASHQWNGNANVAVLEKQLISLMRHSKKLIGDIIENEFIARNRLRDDLEDKTLTRVDRLQFEILVDSDDWSQSYMGEDTASQGSYSFNIDDKPYEFRNHGDRLDYIVKLEIPDDAGYTAADNILNDIRAWAIKEGAKGKPEITAGWEEEAERETVEIILTYKLADGIKGEEIGEWYVDLYKEFGPEANEKFSDIVEKHLDRQADAGKQKPKTLDRQSFISAIDDALEEIAPETEDPTNQYGVEGGIWDFSVGDLSFIVINASDKMLLWYTVQLPALGDSGQILDAVRKSVGNITPDNADKMDIAWMPGLEETWFYVGATYNYNGSNSIEDIQNAYNDFVYDWVKNQINPKIQKTFADFGN